MDITKERAVHACARAHRTLWLIWLLVINIIVATVVTIIELLVDRDWNCGLQQCSTSSITRKVSKGLEGCRVETTGTAVCAFSWAVVVVVGGRGSTTISVHIHRPFSQAA